MNKTLAERAKKAKEMGSGVGRGNKLEAARLAFKIWLLIPRTFLGHAEQVHKLLGITDPELVEIYSLRSQGEFGEKFGVSEPTLSQWKKEMRDGNDLNDFKKHMQQHTKNVVGALYRQALVEGDAARIKLWMQIVEDWHESTHLNMSVGAETGLSDEEKVALDRLLVLNSAP